MSNLLVIDMEQIVPLDFFTGNGVSTLLAAAKPKIDAFTADATTKEGKAEIRAAVKEIIQVRDLFDRMKVRTNRDLKEQPKLVDKNGKLMKDTLNEWKVKVRADLTAIEQVEKDKALAEELLLQEAEEKRLADIDAREAIVAKKEADIKQKEREDQIAKESAELAKKEQADALKAAQDAKVALEQKAKEDARIAELKAKADAEQAEKDKEAAIQKVKDDAALAEGKRLADEAQVEREAKIAQDKADKAEADRKADVEHQKEVNTAVFDGLMSVYNEYACDEMDDIMKHIIRAIVRRQIRHVKIEY